MVLINYAGREINAKIVYYGPGLSGKTTNLECIYASVPQQSRGKMVSMKTRQDRTLFFDFLPLELGEVHGFRTRFLLYTVPGQVFYNATRKLVLKGADAVVFVADSGLGKMDDNRESLGNLDENLREQGLSLDTLPFVLQYNKRDLPQVYSIEELDQALNPRGVPAFEAAAASGKGVYETLHAVSRLLFQRLVHDLRPNAARPGQAAAPAAAPPQAAPPPPVAAPVRARSAAVSPQPGPPARQAAPAPAPAPARQPAPTPVAARHAVPADPRFQRPSETHVRTAPAPEPVYEELGATPNMAFAGPASGHVPTPGGPQQILASVEASARQLEDEETELQQPDYASYGHVVDLPGQAEPETAPGFIKDPLRRADRAAAPRGGAAPTPARSQQVTVTIPRGDLKPGQTIRIVLDIRVEP
jgi:signal recognition particle receptor subunit beta